MKILKILKQQLPCRRLTRRRRNRKGAEEGEEGHASKGPATRQDQGKTSSLPHNQHKSNQSISLASTTTLENESVPFLGGNEILNSGLAVIHIAHGADDVSELLFFDSVLDVPAPLQEGGGYLRRACFVSERDGDADDDSSSDDEPDS